MTCRWYILGGPNMRTPIPSPLGDRTERNRQMAVPTLFRVAETKLDSGPDDRVSTVFLFLDHSHTPDGPPMLFETLIFGGPMGGMMRRYSTWEEAERGHAEVVAEVLAGESALATSFVSRRFGWS